MVRGSGASQGQTLNPADVGDREPTTDVQTEGSVDAADPAEDSTRPAASPGASDVVRDSGASQGQTLDPCELARQFLDANRDSCTDKWREFTRKRTGQ